MRQTPMLNLLDSPIVTGLQPLALSPHLDGESRGELEIDTFGDSFSFLFSFSAETFMDILMFHPLKYSSMRASPS